jgi:hypothetical protein
VGEKRGGSGWREGGGGTVLMREGGEGARLIREREAEAEEWD